MRLLVLLQTAGFLTEGHCISLSLPGFPSDSKVKKISTQTSALFHSDEIVQDFHLIPF